MKGYDRYSSPLPSVRKRTFWATRWRTYRHLKFFLPKLGNSLGALMWNFWQAVSCSREGHVCTLHCAVIQFSRNCTVNVLQEAECGQNSMFLKPANFGHLSRGQLAPFNPSVISG